MPCIDLHCAARDCREHFDGNDRCTLASLRYSATVEGWRHDPVGDWCPWHSPAQETAAREGASYERLGLQVAGEVHPRR